MYPVNTSCCIELCFVANEALSNIIAKYGKVKLKFVAQILLVNAGMVSFRNVSKVVSFKEHMSSLANNS